MSKTNPILMKTCSVCGLQKPLSAFLEFSGPGGATYGNVCSNCRKTLAEKSKLVKETEEDTASRSGHQIDSNVKIQADIDKKEHRERIEEEYHEERDKDEKIELDKSEKTESVSRDEKKHREGYLDKRSYLISNKKVDSQRTFQIKQNVETQNRQTFNVTETQKQEEAGKEMREQGEINMSAPIEDTRITGKIKYSGAAIQSFAAAWGKTPFSSFLTKEKTQQKPAGVAEKKSLVEKIEKTWGPSSKKR